MKKFWIALLLTLPSCLPFGQKARHQALCGKATLQLYYNLQKDWHKGHGRYAGFIEQLNMDPPQECRNDWYYDMKVAGDGQSYVVSVEQRPVQETWTIDQTGFLRDPEENKSLLKGKN